MVYVNFPEACEVMCRAEIAANGRGHVVVGASGPLLPPAVGGDGGGRSHWTPQTSLSLTLLP